MPGAASRQRSGVTAQGGQAERTVTEFFRADVSGFLARSNNDSGVTRAIRQYALQEQAE